MTLLLLLYACAPSGGGAAPLPVSEVAPPAPLAPSAPAPSAAPVAPRADPGARVVLLDARWCAALRTGVVRCDKVALSPPGAPLAGTDTALGDVRALAVYDDSLISLHADGTLRATRMSGSSPPPSLPAGTFGALARSSASGSCALTVQGEAACWDLRPGKAAVLPPGPYDALASQHGRVCGLRPAGAPVCWSATPGDPRLQHLSAGAPASALALGSNSVCATGAETQCWGKLASPAPGRALTHLSVNPGAPDAPPEVESACGITAEGALSCWGNAGAPPEGRFADVVNGDAVTCALREDDQVLCWKHPLAYAAEGPGDGD